MPDPVTTTVEGASISGVVVDPAGNPLSGMYVSYAGFLRVDADDLGRFMIQGLEPGTYELLAQSARVFTTSDTRTGQQVTVARNQHRSGVSLRYEWDPAKAISGRIADPRDEPLGEVRVRAEDSPGHTAVSVLTDADGTYKIELDADGLFTVLVNTHAYATQRREGVPAGTRNVNFVLQPRGFIEGRVVDARTGSPVTKFQLHGRSAKPVGDLDEIFGHRVKSDDGSFRLKWVEPGGVLLYVEAKGYAPARVLVPKVPPGGATKGVVVRLSRGASIEGVVVDMAGKPVAGAQVTLEGQEDERLRTGYISGGPILNTVSDGAGRFVFHALDTGSDLVTATHPDFPDTSAALRLEMEKASRVTIVMTGRATVEGTITINGEPAGGQGVLIYPSDRATPITTKTDNAGFYRVSNLSDGMTTVSASVTIAGFNRNKEARSSLQSGFATTVDIDFVMGTCGITGQISRDAKPYVPKAVFVDVPDDDRSWDSSQPRGSIADSGRYLVSGLFPGTHRLVVVLPYPLEGGRNWVVRDATLREGETVTLDIELPGE